MELKTLDELVEKGKQINKKIVMAVPAAEGDYIIETAQIAKHEGLADSILIGNRKKIEDILQKQGISNDAFSIVEANNHEECAVKAVQLVNSGNANFILKGLLSTTDLLHEVVKKENNLRTGRTMSHFALYEIPGYHKLLVNTDGGMANPQDAKRKADITHNAIDTMRKLGVEIPKAAILCCKGKVDEKMPETVDARYVRECARNGEFGPCCVEGPISYDIAMTPAHAKIKKFDCPCSGDFDILVAPNIHAGNILGKCFSETCGGHCAAIIVGAKIPIVAASRASVTKTKLTSIAVAALVSAAEGNV